MRASFPRDKGPEKWTLIGRGTINIIIYKEGKTLLPRRKHQKLFQMLELNYVIKIDVYDSRSYNPR